MFSRIWYVLGDFGQEIQRIEHLAVAGRTGQQFPVARLGESPHRVVFGLVTPSLTSAWMGGCQWINCPKVWMAPTIPGAASGRPLAARYTVITVRAAARHNSPSSRRSNRK